MVLAAMLLHSQISAINLICIMLILQIRMMGKIAK